METEKKFDLSRDVKEKRNFNFFCKDAKYVAKNILGDFLVVKEKKQILVGRITETEGYLGLSDDASHSFGGRQTNRNRILYQKGGLIYVYLIYGLHWCFNIVVSKKSDPQSVFIRALEPIQGVKAMEKRRGGKEKNLTNGPCRWTEAFGIKGDFLGKSIVSNEIFILEKKKKDFTAVKAPRIGIDYAVSSKNLPLRYCIEKRKSS